MPDARVDIAIPRWMIEARLESAIYSSERHAGDDETSGTEITARVMRCNFTARPRQTGDANADIWAISLAILVSVVDPEENPSVGALAQAASEVVSLFDEYCTATTPDSAASDHTLTMGRATYEEDPQPSDNRAVRTAMVTVEGYVQRDSGATRTTAFIT